jgi:hypothetical protein
MNCNAVSSFRKLLRFGLFLSPYQPVQNCEDSYRKQKAALAGGHKYSMDLIANPDAGFCQHGGSKQPCQIYW